MLTRTMLALVTVFGGAVAGCATGPVEPGELGTAMEPLTCVEAAELAGITSGNQALQLVNPVVPSRVVIDDVRAIELAPRPTPAGERLELSGTLGVYGVIVERVVGRAAELDQVEPDVVSQMPFDARAHVELAGELGVYDSVLERRVELYLRDPALAGPIVLPVSAHPRTKQPYEPFEGYLLRVCLVR